MNSLQSRDYMVRLQETLKTLDMASIDKAIDVIARAWLSGRQIIALGNGGSALAVLHYITDWNKMLFLACGKPFRGVSLVDNMGVLTAYANDCSYEEVFVAQLRNIMQPGDLVIAVSGSGNSENVIRAVQYANVNNAVTLGLTGYDGGRLKPLAQHNVWASVDDMQLSEDVFGIFGHMALRALLAAGSSPDRKSATHIGEVE